MSNNHILLFLFIFSIIWGNTLSARENPVEKEFKDFLKNYESKVVPLEKEQNVAYFNAAVSGKDEDYKKSEQLQIQMTKIYANKQDFALLEKFKKSGGISDPLLKRQLQVIYLGYLGNQVNEKKLEELIKRQTAIEQKFSTFRATVNGKQVTDNEINEALVKSKDSNELKNYWEGSKQIGQVVAMDVIELVKLRNEVAKELGFKNYHTMSLTLSEEDPQKIEKLFDELDQLTRDTFKKMKQQLDTSLASQYGIHLNQMRPWHYHDRFFQEAPQIYQVDFDAFYKNTKVIDLAKQYYTGIGLEIDELASHSDLYEKEGKQQHAFCSAIDREGDVRVLENIVPNLKWMDTTLHE
ncbi:MAG: M2 family metallopeptidase, partial [Pseudomonadota bacterium]